MMNNSFLYIPLCLYYYWMELKGIDVSSNPLHSTMSLLLPRSPFFPAFNFATLHSTMSLLLLRGNHYDLLHRRNFTFHYVSITTYFFQSNADVLLTLHSTMSLLLLCVVCCVWPVLLSLHSTMSLLLRRDNQILRKLERLYIPLCLYYYNMFISSINK